MQAHEQASSPTITAFDMNGLPGRALGVTPLHLRQAAPFKATAPKAIRAFERRDIPRVAELFVDTFRRGRSYRAQDLCTAIEATYFGGPAYRPETGSFVHVAAQDRIDGFMGMINIRLRLGERMLTAGIMSAFMADRSAAGAEVGVQLSRTVSALPLDVVFTDTANRTSLDFSRALRFKVLPTHSLEWTKLLKPAAAGAYRLSRSRPRLRRWIAPVAAAIDAGLPALAATAIDQRGLDGTTDRAMPLAEFIAEAPGLGPADALRPAWDQPELSWIMAQAELRTRDGPLQIRQVHDRGGRRIGLYLLYAAPGGVAFALQVLARPGREGQVLASLIVQAERCGAVAVRGAASPEIIEGLLRQPGVTYRNDMSTVVRTTDPQIAEAIRRGNVMLGGLAGETWARIFGDDFSSQGP